jgi:hypothetical protein
MPTKPGDRQRFAGWIADWESLRNDVHVLFVCREVFTALDEELFRSQRAGTQLILEKFLRPMYFDAQSVRLRRLADNDKRTVSFRRLLLDMVSHCDVLSRDRYLATMLEPERADEQRIRFANRLFDQLAGTGADFVDPAILNSFAEELERDVQKVSHCVDQYVAHRDRAAEPPIRWGDLDQAVNNLGDHYSRIGSYLTGAHHVAEVIIEPGWRRVFSPSLFLSPISTLEHLDHSFS